jgi:hypothetical protein
MNERVVKGNKRIFLESSYDIETIFEAFSVASEHDKELQFMDRLIANLRMQPDGDLVEISYNILRSLNLTTLTNKRNN